jgi:enoyl-[acyl-carrier protein] reductase / trans-2-enoyl-CoA reductase (NAD+)
MRIEPQIQGVVAQNAHPSGCDQSIRQQIEYVKSHILPPLQQSQLAKRKNHHSKRVLIIGGSSGYGLAARIALTFGSTGADTISVSLEKSPTTETTGSAGFYNNYYFKQYAQADGHIAINIHGDAYAQNTKEQVIEAIETYFEGEVDLIIYSLASSKRRMPNSDQFWHAAIKPIGETINCSMISLESDTWLDKTLEPASEEEIAATIKVMGGEDWTAWIDTLINAESVATGCQTIAFSYVGPSATHPIYLNGTLGRAKIDLHQTSHALNLEMANFDGSAYAVVCQAVVTKASVFIPGLIPYLCALNTILDKHNMNECCIEQMHRLFSKTLYAQPRPPVDGERLIRLDDIELNPVYSLQTLNLLSTINADNFAQMTSYQKIKHNFLTLNGFGYDAIDYTKPIGIKRFL